MKRSRPPAKSTEPCARCGKNPRRPFSENCPLCTADIRAEKQRERRAKERETRQPKPRPCKCGCDIPVFAPAQYATADCKRLGRSVSVKEYNAKRKGRPVDHPERFGLKPHRPEPPPPRKPVIDDDTAERLRREASAEDAEWHKRFMAKTLGLESAPGQPLASKVVRPPKEVWRELEKAYRPQSSHEREIFIPARADISY